MENLIFTDKNKFEETKRRFQEDGLDRVHVLTDFDRTLTRAFVDGQEVPSIISVLRDENYLTSDYANEAHRLYNKYRPLEDDENILKEQRKKIMNEWWSTHFKLLVKSGLTKKDVREATKSNRIRFRGGFSELARFLKNNNIPLIIMSAAGLGKEAILQKLKREGVLYDNIHIISNTFEWGSDGRATATKEPIVHNANKDETLVKNFPEVFEIIKDRKNVILLGDSLDDVEMIDGFDYDNLIKVAFLSKKTQEKKDIYKKLYDVLVPGDASLSFVNSFLGSIFR